MIFYYDIVCPFAYMSSRLIEAVGRRARVPITWRPVLLAGLYEATSAPQGKKGSALDAMNITRLKIISNDLHRQMYRHGTPYREPSSHPQKTVTAMRLLAGIPDNDIRAALSHTLYRAYWCEDKDVTDVGVLRELAAGHGVDVSPILQSDAASQQLRSNTSEAASRGAFGVPGFYVGNRLYWGTDRLFFVEQQLGTADAGPERLMEPLGPGSADLTFFFDYSSPWSFLACRRLDSVLQSVRPIQVNIEWVPILLGALFKEIGTPVVPAAALIEAKREHLFQDLRDWSEYAGAKLKWPDNFPLRTVLPLRVTLASQCNPQLISALFTAAWEQNKDIGKAEVVSEVLAEQGLDVDGLLSAANSETIKKQLFSNTTRAVEEELCGVPTFQVNRGPLIWGQDKLNIVADMICGWQDHLQAKL